MRARSTKMTKAYRKRQEVVAAVLEEANGLCAVYWERGVCTGWATDVHEPLTRARSGNTVEAILDRENCVATCRACHDAIHAHPAEALRRGLLVASSF